MAHKDLDKNLFHVMPGREGLVKCYSMLHLMAIAQRGRDKITFDSARGPGNFHLMAIFDATSEPG